MTTFKKHSSKGYLYIASDDTNCINLTITPLKKDIYNPGYLFKLPKFNYDHIKRLSREEFVKFCLTYLKNFYIDITYKYENK